MRKQQQGANHQLSQAVLNSKSEQLKLLQILDWRRPMLPMLDPWKPIIIKYQTMHLQLVNGLYYYQTSDKEEIKILQNQMMHYQNWIDYYYELHSVDRLSGSIKSYQLSSSYALGKAPSLSYIYKTINFYQNTLWNVRFDQKFINKVKEFNNESQIQFIHTIVSYIANGNINPDASHLQIEYLGNDPSPYCGFFLARISGNKFLLFMTQIEKIPILFKNQERISRFEYHHIMKFLDILQDNQVNKKQQNLQIIMSNFFKKMSNDIGLADLDQELIEDAKANKTVTTLFQQIEHNQDKSEVRCVIEPIQDENKNQKLSKHELHIQETLKRQQQEDEKKNSQSWGGLKRNQADGGKYHPTKFMPDYLTSNQSESLIYDSKKMIWVEKNKQLKQENNQFKQFQQKLNKEVLDQYADFKSCQKLVELLQKIPNFKIKLTEEEQQVIGQNGNVMVIGRSGTGKTTCAIMRLFSIEMLFKIRVQMYKNKHQNLLRDTRFTEDDVDANIGLHCIFVTASPVLTNEVKRYYQRLTDQIKDELKKKKERVQQEKKKQEEQLMRQKNELEQQQKQTQEQIVENIIEFEISMKQEQKSKEEQEEELKQQLELQMEQQFEGIQLKKQISHESQQEEEQKMQQEEEIFDIDEEEIEQQMHNFQSLNDLQEQDYPGFFTVRSLLMMIDACLTKPFFARNQENHIIGQDTKSTWHNESKGILVIDNYYKKIKSGQSKDHGEEDNKEQDNQEQQFLEDSDFEEQNEYDDEEDLENEYQRQLYLQQQRVKQGAAKFQENKKGVVKKLAFEVDYNYFVTYFWPTIAKQFYTKQHNFITPSTVWTEIYSHIKGSAVSHTYVGWYISRYSYIWGDQQRSFLNQDMKKTIYEIFYQYESWKVQQGGYDLMDLVNYELVQVRYNRYNGPPLHYMMIDEVQDLPHAILLLFMKLTEQGLFFAGDTAQSIAQGVSFRFCDLKSLFDVKNFQDWNLKTPVVKQLTVNFRSHNNILELANSIVTCLEIFFPKTIDKLRKEKSNIDGPKPILLNSTSPELLFFILCGEEQFRKLIPQNQQNSQQIDHSVSTNPLEFGCNQVIIVRDQESKKRLPSVLSHALCLTIYESKGLEFDDVILYNFFTDSTVELNKWGLLNSLMLEEEWMEKKEFLQTITMHQQENMLKNEQGNIEEDVISCYGMQEKGDQVSVMKVKGNKQTMKDLDILKYSSLCADLKQLYVAVTRPKKRLIIYDDNLENRKYIQNYWSKLNRVEIIDFNLIQDLMNPQNQKKNQDESREINMFRAILTETTQKEWKLQGMKMFKHKYFEQAIKCFDKADEKELGERARAYLYADNASKRLVEIEADREYLNNGLYQYSQMSKQDKKLAKKAQVQKEKTVTDDFRKAAELFLKFNKKKQAAQCYFSAKLFKEAAIIFNEIGSFKQAGEAFYLLGNYKEAAELFDKGGDYLRVISCFDFLTDYEKILQTIYKYGNIIAIKDKEQFIRKYAPLAMEELVSKIELQSKIEDEKQNPDSDQEEKKQNFDQTIQEEEDEYLSSDEDDDEEEEEKQELNNNTNNANNQNQDKEQKNQSQQLNEAIQNKNQQEQIVLIHEQTTINEQILNKSLLQQQSETGTISQQNNNNVNISEMDFDMNEQSKNSSFSIIATNNKKNNKEEVEEQKETHNVSSMSFEQIQQLSQKSIKKQQENNLVEDMSFSQMSFNGEQKKGDDIDQSFEMILQKQISSQQQLTSFDHLSQYDLQQDEWLQMEQGSVIESISDARKSKSNIFSDYSAVEFNQMVQPSMQLVKTKTDIFIQDNIMQKIIQYINMFNQEFQQVLNNLRSSQSMLSTQKQKQEEGGDVEDYDLIIDLDNVDLDLIYLILDILETFKIYKLCIFVCNRYRLSQRIGRYVVSISHKYSFVSTENCALDQNLLYTGLQRQKVLEKAFIGSLAVHNIFENINPDFLKSKSENQELNNQNSLGGIDCYQSMVLLGFWKKILFQLDYKNALALSSSYADYKNYKYIFLSQSAKYCNEANKIKMVLDETSYFDQIPFEVPENKNEIQFAMISLEHLIWDIVAKSEKFVIFHEYVSRQYQEEVKFQQNIQKKTFLCCSDNHQITFPSYFAYTGVLINYILTSYQKPKKIKRKELKQYILTGFQSLKKILNPKQEFNSELIELRIFDLTCFATILASFMTYKEDDEQYNEYGKAPSNFQFQKLFLRMLDDNEFSEIMEIYYDLFRTLNETILMNRYTKAILKGLFAPFRVRLIEDSEIMKLINHNHVLVHRGSSIIHSLINFKNLKIVEAASLNQNVKKNVIEEIFFADIDYELLVVPIDIALTQIKQKLYKKIDHIINLKINQNRREIRNIQLCREEMQEDVYKITNNLGLQSIKTNFEFYFKNLQTKENFNQKMNKLIPVYKDVDRNDLVLKYRMLEKEQNERELFSSDEEFQEELIREGILKKKKKKNNKKNFVSIQKFIKNAENFANENDKNNVDLTKINYILSFNIGLCPHKITKQAREAMLMFIYSYLRLEISQDESINYNIIKIKRILHFIGEDYKFNEIVRYLRKITNKYGKKTIKAFQAYEDSQYYQEYGQTPEFCESIFEYFSLKFKVLDDYERLILLEQTFVYFLLSLAQGKKLKTLFLCSHLLKYIPNLKYIKELEIKSQEMGDSKPCVYELHNKFCPLDTNDNLSEILYWIQKAIEFQCVLKDQEPNIMLIIIHIILNIDFIDHFITEIMQILGAFKSSKYLQSYNLYDTLLSCKNKNELKKLIPQLIDENYMIPIVFNSVNTLDNVNFVNTVNLIPGTDAEIDLQYQQSDSQYKNDEIKVVQRLNAKRILFRFIKEKMHQFKKSRSKIINSPLVYWNISQTFDLNTSQNYLLNIFKLSMSKGHLFEVFRFIEKNKRDIINSYYQTYIDSAIDYHYIVSQLSQLSSHLDNFNQKLQICFNNFDEKSQNSVSDEFINTKNWLQKFEENFANWKNLNIKYEPDVKKLLNRNKLISNVKWSQRGLINRASKIAKKRAGLRKQKALDQKKLRIAKK